METPVPTKTMRFTSHVTKDYSVFKTPAYQREVNKNYVNKLKKSLRETGQIEQVTVDQQGNIIDGQHRVEALKQLGMPVWYCINHALNSDDNSSSACKDANNVSNKWGVMNYVNWAKQNGNDVVAEAEEIAKEWSAMTRKQLTVPLALELLSGSKSANVKRDLDKLDYRLNYDLAKNVFDFAYFLKDYVVGNSFSARIIRPLKTLSAEKGGLKLSVAKKMCTKKHIRVFNTQQDNYDFIKELYEKYE